MENKKLNVGFVTSNPLVKTGFSHNAKNILPLLYNSDKYNIFLLAQSSPENDPNFQRMPWKTYGVFKNFDQQRFNQDPGYQRHVAYGNTAVEQFILNNKLDVCFHIEDIWSSSSEAYLNADWFKHIKDNFVQWSTADSEPILPNFKEWAEKCPNVWFWGSFAERCLKEENKEKYGHCKTLFGSMNIKHWKPLPENERKQLRNSFNIKDDEKIIIYLGRNQLRKLYWSHMEGLKKFKEKNPDKKLKLLFHCSWNEGGMGWPLERIRDELKLDKEDVLTSYYCKGCGFWNVQPFQGEDLDCPVCKQKTRITAGIGSTINEEDLNKIYNLADGSCSIFTSGGFEYTHAESLLAGLPLASVNYSCGEDFCKNDFVKTINGTFTRECGTSFKKFVPNIDSIVDFYEYIYNLNPLEKEKISRKGRKWAIENFDAKVIAGKIEKFIDSCKPIDWDVYFSKKKELKNVQAQIEDKQTDEDFVLECYTKILNNPSVKENDSGGFDHWLNFLKQPKDKNQLKQEMVNVFRNAAAQHNQKVQPPISIEDILIKNGKKQFLIVCPQSAGDIINASSLLKSFRESYPSDEWNIYFACQPEFQELLELNPYIDRILHYQPFMDNEIGMLGQVNKGPFQGFCFIPALSQKFLSYLGNHNINLNLKYE